jgi:hypothetical protein
VRRLALVTFVLCLALPAFARQRVSGWCEQGNGTVTVGGLSTTTKWMQSFPASTVSVFATGTTNLSTIYADNSGTAKANPFTCASDGFYFFYVDAGRYDVKFSGTGITTPFTKADYLTFDPAQFTFGVDAVAFSATPTFDASAGSIITMTLTGNVTSSTITNSLSGQIIAFSLCQDGTGGRTFSWPALFVRPPPVNTTASSCSDSTFFYDGTNWRHIGSGDSAGFAGDLTVSGKANVTGNTVLSGTLGVTGATTLSTLGVTGATTTAGISDSSSVTAPIYKTTSATLATAGNIRFATGDTLQWRNNANTLNLALNKDTADVFHIPGQMEWDCGASGQPTCNGGLEQIVLADNNNPGVDGNGYFIRWAANTSTGVAKNPTQIQGGFASAANGAEQATLDIINYVGGALRGLAIGGIVGGGAVPAVTPTDNGIWQLGRSGTGFLKTRMEGTNPSTEYRNNAAALPNGLHRILETGNDFIINRNTAAGGDFSTNTNDFIIRGVDGDLQIGTGVYVDGGGVKHQRQATTCATAAAAGATCTVTITWTTAFANANYSTVCTGEGVTTGVPVVGATTTKLVGSVLVQTVAVTAVAAQFTVMDCIAFEP